MKNLSQLWLIENSTVSFNTMSWLNIEVLVGCAHYYWFCYRSLWLPSLLLILLQIALAAFITVDSVTDRFGRPHYCWFCYRSLWPPSLLLILLQIALAALLHSATRHSYSLDRYAQCFLLQEKFTVKNARVLDPVKNTRVIPCLFIQADGTSHLETKTKPEE